jgi:hypothetical protein
MTWVPAILEQDRRPGMKEAAQRIRAASVFMRGLLLGFISAFVVFDFALLQGDPPDVRSRWCDIACGTFLIGPEWLGAAKKRPQTQCKVITGAQTQERWPFGGATGV